MCVQVVWRMRSRRADPPRRRRTPRTECTVHTLQETPLSSSAPSFPLTPYPLSPPPPAIMQAAGPSSNSRSKAGQKRSLAAGGDQQTTSSSVPGTMAAATEEGYSSSDSSSDSSSSSSSSSSSEGSSTSDNAGISEDSATAASLDSVFEEDDYGKYFPVSCADNDARLYMKRFARGSVGKCILFKGKWCTPNEFQSLSGRKSSKDWKRSIRLGGRILKEYITQGLFEEHSKLCSCKVCSGSDVEMLKQEGEMALAAKRRRLSQADSHPPPLSGTTQMSSVPESEVKHDPNARAARVRPRKTQEEPTTGSKRKQNSNNSSPSKIWSPSGETALGGSSSNEEEEEYRPKEVSTATGQDLPPSTAVVDSSDFIPRRSRRSTHRKHVGHRTELGTFTHKPSQWDTEEVSQFLQLQGYGQYSESFSNNEIDGQSMFLLHEHHLMERFQMKLGPALTLINIISRLRHPPTC